MYNEITANRIREIFDEKGVKYFDKKMFGGLCFFVDDKMCIGIMSNKKYNEELLMCRIGEEEYNNALSKKGCLPMDFTGRPMIGFVFVSEIGYASYEDLTFWIDLCLKFNPLAKKSKK